MPSITRAKHSFNPADAAIVIGDEDPTTSLIELTRVERAAIEAIIEQRLAEHILAGLSTSGGLLNHLGERGIWLEQVRLAAR